MGTHVGSYNGFDYSNALPERYVEDAPKPAPPNPKVHSPS